MKKILFGILIFLVGVLGTLWLTKEKHTLVSESQLIYNGLKQIAKLQVTEGYFTEVHNYKDSKSYFNNILSFDKKALVVVNAKVQIAYDLKKLDVRIDSIKRRVLIKHIPEPEVTIVPDITYYDVQQSSFNTFNASDYNKIKKKVMHELKENKAVIDLKKQAHNRLFEELSQLLLLSKYFKWEVVDETKVLDFNLLGAD